MEIVGIKYINTHRIVYLLNIVARYT